MCPNSLAKDDPKCLHGGRLHANNSTMDGAEYYANCVYCDCPDGWGGPDCSRALHCPGPRLWASDRLSGLMFGSAENFTSTFGLDLAGLWLC